METQEYPRAGLPNKQIAGATQFREAQSTRASGLLFPRVMMTSEWEGSRSSHLMIIPNTKRHPDNTKTDQLPFGGGDYRPSKAVP